MTVGQHKKLAVYLPDLRLSAGLKPEAPLWDSEKEGVFWLL